VEPCTINDCSRESIARGLCLMHYKRWRRKNPAERIVASSETEIKIIPSLPGYGASEDGTIWKLYRGVEWRPRGISHDKDGYPTVIIKHKGSRRAFSKKVHRLVAEAFIGPIPKGMAVNHKDGVKTNSRRENLEVISGPENTAHASKIGLLRGSKWNTKKTRCPAGHAYDDGNTHITKAGHRQCRTCGRERAVKYRAAKR
jgi:HNH endonuclease